MEQREIMTVGDAKAVSDLLALPADLETGFPVSSLNVDRRLMNPLRLLSRPMVG
jgi:hypothetical protein